MIKNVNVSVEMAKEHGIKVAYLYAILKEHCKADEWTKLSVDTMLDYAFTLRTQTALIEKLVQAGFIETKKDPYDKFRYVRILK